MKIDISFSIAVATQAWGLVTGQLELRHGPRVGARLDMNPYLHSAIESGMPRYLTVESIANSESGAEGAVEFEMIVLDSDEQAAAVVTKLEADGGLFVVKYSE